MSSTSDPRPPSSLSGSQPVQSSSTVASPSTSRAAGPPAPSSPTRSKSDYHLRPPTSPTTHSGMPTASTPLRADVAAARLQNPSSTSSPNASLNPASGGAGHSYQPSVQSSAASFVSSASGDEEGDGATGARDRDAPGGARSAAATARPPPSSYAPAARASTSRQPSANRLSTLGIGTPQAAATVRQRSSSRARPPNRRHHTTTANVSAAEDDDEVRVLDRGEELIRRRNRERRAHAAALGRGQSFIDNPNASIGSSTGGAVTESRRVSRSKTPRDRDSLYSQPAPQTPTSPFMPVRHGPFEGGSLRREASRDRTPSIVGDASETGSVAGEPLGNSWHGSVKDAEAVEGEDMLETHETDDEPELEGDERDEDDDDDEDVELTLRDRQDAINIEHPFGLPIWKPALYKKSRTVTRQADSALHAIPSAAAQRHLLPGNLVWILFVGWWLALLCFLLATVLWCIEGGGRGRYARVIAGLGWYIGWPFGKYVEGEGLRGAKNADGEALEVIDDEGHAAYYHAPPTNSSDQSDSEGTIRGSPGPPERNAEAADRIMPLPGRKRRDGVSAGDDDGDDEDDDGGSHATIRTATPAEREPLLTKQPNVAFAGDSVIAKGKARPLDDNRPNGYGSLQAHRDRRSSLSEEFLTGIRSPPTVWLVLGRVVFWPLFLLVLAPIMLAVCILCWGGIVTIPMAKLLWALLKLLWSRPLELGFKPAPTVVIPESAADDEASVDTAAFMKRERLRAGQVAPTGGPTSTVLLCTYKAVGTQYFKYTIGGVNILFVNLLPLVFFVIFDAFVLLPLSEKHDLGRLLNLLANRGFIFLLSLASVIPLSYFIGMAVASISAQSSIGMGAVINATFGSIIEIILYSIALTQGKGRLVEGSLVGSLLAGVLVMPGMSMLSGAFRRKEQSFNAKSAGVTSTMLIMAILGILTPTVFYQAYGSVELSCSGCPDGRSPNDLPDNQPWMCHSCRYVHPDPAKDPFYQDRVKNLMYICASLLLLSYLIGLWFSLKTHASQIWQNPQQILHQPELITSAHAVHPAHRASVHNRLPPGSLGLAPKDLLPSHATSSTSTVRPSSPAPVRPGVSRRESAQSICLPAAMSHSAHSLGSASGAHAAPMPGTLTPFVENIVRKDVKNMPPLSLDDPAVAHDYFAKAVTAATVSALRHQQSISAASKGARPHSAAVIVHHEGDGHGGGHEGPSWDRKTSASVLLACTALYAIIAEILVDVVDVILEGSGIDEKFLGVTLFALVPNTTEFMNAMSFALNGNIALSMEIGSAYALQVCLLQIPAMVAFSAIYDPSKMGEIVDTFTLILPQFDCISIMFSIFLLTYTYIEARANYHRGSILILAYLVLLAGFYYAPSQEVDEQRWPLGSGSDLVDGFQVTAAAGTVPLPSLMNVAARFRGLFA